MNHYREEINRFRVALLAHMLAAADGDVPRAAARLGLSRTYLWRLLRTHGIIAQTRAEALERSDHDASRTR